ncbi:hypothetical protein WKW77_05635 [Variovorax ureilyticus]|uniref:Uncharacterized protein n=1 Tax=Variovorax ureilyticus TaxID=1836198 RepID=A0ABU8VBF0_9BURK
MPASSDIDALRRDYDRARVEYLVAQYRLLGRLFGADARNGEWPSATEYEATAALGRAASAALRTYLDGLNVAKRPPRTVADRLRLIHRLSANERLWQPTPGDWLKQQGFE